MGSFPFGVFSHDLKIHVAMFRFFVDCQFEGSSFYGLQFCLFHFLQDDIMLCFSSCVLIW